MKNYVRFFYMRDPECQGRLITVARRWANEERTAIVFQYAVCHPGGKILVDDEYGYFEKEVKPDIPTKKRGREIATGRLEVRPFRVELNGRRQLTAICETLSDETDEFGNRNAAKTAAAGWYFPWLRDNMKKTSQFDAVDRSIIPQCVRHIARGYLKQFEERAKESGVKPIPDVMEKESNRVVEAVE